MLPPLKSKGSDEARKGRTQPCDVVPVDQRTRSAALEIEQHDDSLVAVEAPLSVPEEEAGRLQADKLPGRPRGAPEAEVAARERTRIVRNA